MGREHLTEVVVSLGITAEAAQQKSATFPEGMTAHKGRCPITHDLVTFEPTAWSVKLAYNGRSMTTMFYRGSGHTKHVECNASLDRHRTTTEPPSAADVLYSLACDADACEMDFEEWCSEIGADPDSRKAEKTYRACQKSGFAVKRLLGDAFERVKNAEH